MHAAYKNLRETRFRVCLILNSQGLALVLGGGGGIPICLVFLGQAVARLPDILRVAGKLGRVGSSENRIPKSLAPNNRAAVFSGSPEGRKQKESLISAQKQTHPTQAVALGLTLSLPGGS